jgi:eukaryotic-like serine/threonine-protein kinase
LAKPAKERYFYEFGPFRIDRDRRQLLRENQPVTLQRKTFDILFVLVENSGKVVSKDDLLKAVWPDAFVEESNLSQQIFVLRKTLGDGVEEKRYIVTVPGRGYRFVQSVRALPVEEESIVVQSHTLSRVVIEEPRKSNKSASWGRRHIVASAMVVATVAAAVVYRYAHPTPKLTVKNAVVLAEFTNNTDDVVFDGALRQGLSAQLEQSPFLNLLSDQRIADSLSLMTLPKESRLTPELAREVCLRTASTVVLSGTIAQIGAQYLLTLTALNCSNGDLLASSEAQASDKNHVLDALGQVATGIRTQLGESLVSVRKYDAPPEDVTTRSLESLKAYSLGYRAFHTGNDQLTGIALLQRAVALDNDFAMAYARLGTAYFNIGETARGAENIRKAYSLRERLSEREKFYIVSHYQDIVMRNVEAARKTYELWLQVYPGDTIPIDNLCITYSLLGDHDKALMYCKKLFEFAEGAMSYANLVNSYLCLNQLGPALATAREARMHNFDNPQIHVYLYAIDFLHRDMRGMEQESAGLMGKAGWEDIIFYSESETAAFQGQFTRARALTIKAAGSAQKADKKEAAVAYLAESAVREALVGNAVLAEHQAKAALSGERSATAMSAAALGMAGQAAQATQLAADLEKRYPEDTIMHSTFLPTIRAAVAIHGKNAKGAIQALQAAVPNELGITASFVTFRCYPAYMRGTADLLAKRGDAAAAEFQKILDHPGLIQNELIGALAHLGLGRAYALSHDMTKAKTEYQNFLLLWKDADPDIPLLKEAKTEYAKL